MPGKVVVAMSGGVDSAVAAALLQEQGFEVLGVTLRLADPTEAERKTSGGCCGTRDLFDAQGVAQKLGIPHYTVDARGVFEKEVLAYFKTSYAAGETPNPCIACNQFVKFEKLLEQAKAFGADFLATGHYARIESRLDGRGLKKFHLKKGVDPSKDQSYVLYRLTQDQLAHLLFPLGGLTKREVRALAQRFGLGVAQKKDSQEVCFTPDAKVYLESELSKAARRPGPLRHVDGRLLGQHRGIPFYTVGQRSGLGVSSRVPLYVVALIPESNSVVVGEKEDVLATTFEVRDVRWISGEAPPLPRRAGVKIRYQHEPALASLTATTKPDPRPGLKPGFRPGLGPGLAVSVRFESPQWAITPGQAAVFYDREEVLGGGVIDRVERKSCPSS